MSSLIIFTGGLATLKTTLSKRIAQDLSLLCLNKDDIKAVLVDHIGFNNREENKKLSNAAVQTMFEIAHGSFLINQSMVIEANFKQPELNAILEKTGYDESQILTIFLQGNPKTLYERYVSRQASRHIAHTSTGLLSFEVFEASIKEHRVEDAIGKVVVIDTTVFTEKHYHILLAVIQSHLNR